MMCYKDMTFCTYYEDCSKSNECLKPFTREVLRQAMNWWGGVNAPIMTFAEKPECWEEKK